MLRDAAGRRQPADAPTADAIEASWPVFHPGDRVKVSEDLIGIHMVAMTGVVLHADPEWDGFYWVQLDVPARDSMTDEAVPVVVDAGDNLTPLNGAATVESARPAPHAPADPRPPTPDPR